MQENSQHYGEVLEAYKFIAEQKLGWGDSAAWRNQDFLALSAKIFEETGVLLSNTTLKRIWGKLSYTSQPNSHTLNALAQFIGYNSWLEFCANTKTPEVQEQMVAKAGAHLSVPQRPGSAPSGPIYWKLFGALMLLVLLFYSFSLIFQKKEKTLGPDDLAKVHFSSAAVAAGIPNTVVFHYDVSGLQAEEVLIQQNWDKRRQFPVAKEAQEASSVYYLPGYYRAKLLIDGQVAKEHDLYIKSGGWLATANTDKRQPRYFLDQERVDKRWLGVSEEILKTEQALADAPLNLGFHYVEDFGDLNSDNFSFETAFRNTYSRGDGLCRFTRIVILCTDGVLIFPFAIPGCVGDLRLVCSELVQEGKDHDFSAFGYTSSNWEKLKVTVQDKKVQLFLNGQLIHELAYQKSAGRVVGMRFLFDGAGEIDDVRLLDSGGSVVFEDDF